MLGERAPGTMEDGSCRVPNAPERSGTSTGLLSPQAGHYARIYERLLAPPVAAVADAA